MTNKQYNKDSHFTLNNILDFFIYLLMTNISALFDEVIIFLSLNIQN